MLRPFIRGRVLEVGAGLGGTTRVLCDGAAASWTALEPDERLLNRLIEAQRTEPFAQPIEPVLGTLSNLDASRTFDCILYIDVLEHIRDDAGEMRAVATHLAAGGNIVVLSPAFPSLFSEFDRAVGHERRYVKKTLRAAIPPGLVLRKLVYLDSVGMTLSLANRLMLRQSQPKASQIRFWDKRVIPIARIVDPLVLHGWGRSIIGVFGKPA